jgi:hypothetical protein
VSKLKLLIVGHGQHGKDSVCEILQKLYGFSFESSSKFCSKLFVFERLKEKYGYATEEDCYNDRLNHRSEWFDLIEGFNTPDKTKLGRAIFGQFDIYCGLRNDLEFFAMEKQSVFDFSIWVDRSKVKPLEPESSMKLKQEWMDFVVDNNGNLNDLKHEIVRLMGIINHFQRIL